MEKPSLEAILKLAEELGIKVEMNSDKPGMYIIQDDGTEKKAEFEDIFPDFFETE